MIVNFANGSVAIAPHLCKKVVFRAMKQYLSVRAQLNAWYHVAAMILFFIGWGFLDGTFPNWLNALVALAIQFLFFMSAGFFVARSKPENITTNLSFFSVVFWTGYILLTARDLIIHPFEYFATAKNIHLIMLAVLVVLIGLLTYSLFLGARLGTRTKDDKSRDTQAGPRDG